MANPVPSDTLVALCQRYERWLSRGVRPWPGDWRAPRRGPQRSVQLIGEPADSLREDEVLVPRLERLLEWLAAECASFVLDWSGGEFACVAFDEHGRSLANVVATDPAVAVAQALVFIRVEREAHERQSDEPGTASSAPT